MSVHTAELGKQKVFSIFPYPKLSIEDGSFTIKFDSDSGDQEDGTSDDDTYK